jgi:hypothetical protein
LHVGKIQHYLLLGLFQIFNFKIFSSFFKEKRAPWTIDYTMLYDSFGEQAVWSTYGVGHGLVIAARVSELRSLDPRIAVKSTVCALCAYIRRTSRRVDVFLSSLQSTVLLHAFDQYIRRLRA